MGISVLLTWNTVFRHVAWTVGYCPYCQRDGAMRVEQALEVFSIFFIPIEKKPVNCLARCDFCERLIESRLDMALFASHDLGIPRPGSQKATE